jgi:hypothetical protein
MSDGSEASSTSGNSDNGAIPTATTNNQPTAVAGDPTTTSTATAPELDAAQTEELDAQLDPSEGELCSFFFCVPFMMIHSNNSNLSHPLLDPFSSLQYPLVVAKKPPAKKRAAAVKKKAPVKKKTATKKKTTTKKKKEAPLPSTPPPRIAPWNDVPAHWFCSLKCCRATKPNVRVDQACSKCHAKLYCSEECFESDFAKHNDECSHAYDKDSEHASLVWVCPPDRSPAKDQFHFLPLMSTHARKKLEAEKKKLAKMGPGERKRYQMRLENDRQERLQRLANAAAAAKQKKRDAVGSKRKFSVHDDLSGAPRQDFKKLMAEAVAAQGLEDEETGEPTVARSPPRITRSGAANVSKEPIVESPARNTRSKKAAKPFSLEVPDDESISAQSSSSNASFVDSELGLRVTRKGRNF